MQCKDVEFVVEQEGLAPLPDAARAHVAACSYCRECVAGPASQIAFAQTAKVLNDQEIDLRNMHLAGTSPVDSSFQQNLQQVDEFIADCERHLKAEPQDELAREYLSNAYQQKAELLSAMMDREGSLH